MRVRLIVLLPIAVLISGCGAGSGDSPAPATGIRSAPQITSDPAHLVLDSGDIGNGYLTVASQTGRDTLQRTMHQDPAPIRAIERRSWVSGYHALYSDGQAGVLTGASLFRTERSALRVSRSWQRSELKAFHGRLIRPPAGSLDHVTMVAGSIPVRGVPSKAYFIQWVHGNVIAGILLFGREATAARVAGLATAQDGRISNAS
jgi:hypothetical protein